MSKERGNRLNRFLDRYAGILLTVPAALFRRFDRVWRRKAENGEVLKVAVICLGAVGDLILLSGVVNGVKKLYPKAETALFTSMDNRLAAPLIEGADLVYSFGVSKFLKMITFLRRERYDLLLDSTQWARIGAIISAFSGAGLTVGFKTAGEARSLAYDKTVLHSPFRHEWENFAHLLQTDISDLKPKLKECKETENLRSLLPKGGFVVLHMFASGSYAKEKEWRSQNWAAVVKYLEDNGYFSVLTGSAEEREKIDEFIEFSAGGQLINLAGRLDLEEVSVLAKRARAVVSVNTGIMHLAALSGAFTIGLHGPSNPVRWGPVGDNTIALVPKGVGSFPPMGGNRIKDESSFTRNIKSEEVIACLEQVL